MDALHGRKGNNMVNGGIYNPCFFTILKKVMYLL